MAKTRNLWKKQRGKLGMFAPLLGNWEAETETPMGRIACRRSLSPILGGSFLQLTAEWDLGKGTYLENAVIGPDSKGIVTFWSFTSDGKNSTGHLADVTDIHPEAVGFEAQMPAGLARMAYWPSEDGGFYWAVESRTKKGWNRFTLHHYRPTII